MAAGRENGTVELEIDGRRVAVEPGTTILEAARRLGIEIPTLCHVGGLEPASSCFLCAVEIEGRPVLAPSCSMPAAEGMVVRTASAEVLATRKMCLELLLSDHAGECIAPCRAACPAGLDIPGFIYPIATGAPRAAMAVIARTLALPGALGRICPRLCEEECRRSERDEGLAIGQLHRYAAEVDLAAGDPYLPARADPSGKEVAIVGAGPAGLAAAFYLLQRGHGCTLFDRHPQPGGMLRYGIPEYRLSREALDAEIDLIRRLGARFRPGRAWGRDFGLAELRRDFDAVFLAVGAQATRGPGCEGEELALPALELLERLGRGERPRLGRRVVVLGGGNTAMDASRSAVRLGAEEVSVFYRRTRREMPCLLEEVEGAEAEGVRIEYLVAPIRLERGGGGGLRLTCVRMELGDADASGRRRPLPVAGSELAVEAEVVVAAVGQAVETDLAEREGLAVTPRGIAADPRTLATSLEGVFAGGDAVLGPDLAVRAVAAGRLAAVSIDQYLRGEPVTGEGRQVNVSLRPCDEEERAEILRRIERAARVRGEEIGLEERLRSFTEVEAGLAGDQALREARRCLSCGCRKSEACDLRRLATAHGAEPLRFSGERRRFAEDLTHPEVAYEPGKCILCEACVRVAAAAGEELGVAIVGRGFGARMAVPFSEALSEGLRRSGLRCVEVCPTGALALKTARACDACRLLSICGGPEGGP